MARTLSDDNKEYLAALKKAHMAIVSGAQSYSIGSRSLTRADLKTINAEIARLEGTTTPRLGRIWMTDL